MTIAIELGLTRAAVIGAGSMGSGIAAHLANAGVEVDLLDIVPEGAQDRNQLARLGIERQLDAGGFMHPDLAHKVHAGNVDDHFDRVAKADWIVEAVFEELQIKRALYARIEAVRKDGSIVSSNTSTIPLKELTAGQDERFARDFVVTHFFNPPRLMKLLEIVGGPETDPAVVARVDAINDRLLGKSNILCFDTPGFIANRVGNYWMSVASLEAFRLGLTVEEADAVMSRPFGIPRTGIMGLFDFVGIQLVPLVWGSFMKTLPVADDHRNFDITQDKTFTSMLDKGLTGRFGPGGFYRRKLADGTRVNQVLDLKTLEYRDAGAVDLPCLADWRDLKALCNHDDKGAQYAWSVLSNVVAYSSEIAGEIARSIGDIDLAMQLGYNWKQGPFALADQVGVDWIAARLKAEGRAVPDLLQQAAKNGGFYPAKGKMQKPGGGLQDMKAADGVLSLDAIKQHSDRIAGNGSASIWDLGDGVACFEVHTKMNALDSDVTALIGQATDILKRSGFKALVVGNDNPRAFSAGARLDVFVDFVNRADWDGLTAFVRGGQLAFYGLKYSDLPVVAAAHGLALGGGGELMMHCNHVVAHCELYAGLPERKVGIMPAWGGATQMVIRHQALHRNKDDGTIAAFRAVIGCINSGSAREAQELGMIRPTDDIVMNKDRVLAMAKAKALELAEGFRPPAKAQIQIGGQAMFDRLVAIAQAERDAGNLTETDLRISTEIARVMAGQGLSGTECDELSLMEKERAALVALAKVDSSQARLDHMLKTNKPLKN